MENMVVNVYDTTECGEVLSSPGYNPGNAESYVCAQKKRTCQTYDDTAGMIPPLSISIPETY